MDTRLARREFFTKDRNAFFRKSFQQRGSPLLQPFLPGFQFPDCSVNSGLRQRNSYHFSLHETSTLLTA